MKVKRGDDSIPHLEEKVWFPTTQAEPPREQSEEALLEERKRTLWRDGKELETTE